MSGLAWRLVKYEWASVARRIYIASLRPWRWTAVAYGGEVQMREYHSTLLAGDRLSQLYPAEW